MGHLTNNANDRGLINVNVVHVKDESELKVGDRLSFGDRKWVLDDIDSDLDNTNGRNWFKFALEGTGASLMTFTDTEVLTLVRAGFISRPVWTPLAIGNGSNVRGN